MPILEINIKKIYGDSLKGVAIVSKIPICFRSEYNPVTGLVEATHPLRGRTIADRILFIPSTKGSSGNPMTMKIMKLEKTAPKALVCLRVDPLVILGCIVNNITFVLIEEDESIFNNISDGDNIEINAEKKLIFVNHNKNKQKGGEENWILN